MESFDWKFQFHHWKKISLTVQIDIQINSKHGLGISPEIGNGVVFTIQYGCGNFFNCYKSHLL